MPPRLEVRSSLIHRQGCFAAEPLPAGTRLRAYTGELITTAEARVREADPTRPGIYTFWIDDDWAIDGWIGGNESIYINHACSPNCHCVREGQQLFIHASRDIALDEELTLDYAYDPKTPLEPCACGSAQCRGYINEVV